MIGTTSVNVALVKTRSGMIAGATDEDRAKLRAWPAGFVARVKVNRPRNIDHHRKFMACVSFVAERHPLFCRYATIDPLLHFLKDETGHWSSYTKPDGEIVRIMRSIAFDEMDEGEFIAWSRKAKPLLVALMDDIGERAKRRHEAELDGWVAWCLEGVE